jgi:hypothetical protein
VWTALTLRMTTAARPGCGACGNSTHIHPRVLDACRCCPTVQQHQAPRSPCEAAAPVAPGACCDEG